MTAPPFHETQRFWSNPLVRFVLAGSVLVAAAAGFVARRSGDIGSTSAFVTLSTMIVVAALVASMRLETDVGDEGLRVRLWPLPGRSYPWSDIESAVARTYEPLREYGGWGLRTSGNGVAWNVHGKDGVQLVLASGRRALIGSQRSYELEARIQERLG